jgi:hypothetical protein
MFDNCLRRISISRMRAPICTAEACSDYAYRHVCLMLYYPTCRIWSLRAVPLCFIAQFCPQLLYLALYLAFGITVHHGGF